MIKKIAVLISCHNRKDKTIKCLNALYSQQGLEVNYRIAVFLVDDGSTDGTTESIKTKFPTVNIIQGDGNLYWNRGMHLAWKTAAATNDFDYYLWLNDDTIVFDNAIKTMLDSSKSLKKEAILCGCTQSFENKKITYGGRKNGMLIEPNGSLQQCDLINGNFVFVSRVVFHKVGMLDPLFHHGIGDYDYGLRAKKAGFDSFVTPVFIGYCEPNISINICFRENVPVLKRLKYLYSPLGVHPVIYFKYDKRHFGLKSGIKHFLSIHFHVLFPTLWPQQ
jgi:GT2 family glycosyltransferase